MTKEDLHLILNVLSEDWERIERQDPDQSMEKWRGYKGIRNNIRASIKKIAKSQSIEL